jgi:outer membrane protein TolC
VDVVDAETALNEAELGLASAYYQLQLDHLSLQLATGAFLKDML